MKKIVAPIDFSETSENAAGYAASLAEFYGADLWLYHAYGMMVPVSEIDAMFINPKQMQQAVEYEMEEFKKRIQSALRRTINIHIKAEIATFTQGLTSLCNELKPDMVVMGLSGKNALARLVVGGNTIRVIQQLSYPVLVVPSKAEFIPIRKIGFACDYEKVKITTPINPLKKFVYHFNAELLVLNVAYNNSDADPEKIEQGKYINELLKEFKPSFQTILSADITNGINWFIEKENIDIMVVIPKKHNLMDKLFSRSHTKDLLYHTHIPVLCMHE
jgi:nucleotide-binding universal stress UspA family protein